MIGTKFNALVAPYELLARHFGQPIWTPSRLGYEVGLSPRNLDFLDFFKVKLLGFLRSLIPGIGFVKANP